MTLPVARGPLSRMFTGMPHGRRLTTKVDHNDMRHSPIERVNGKPSSQVSDGSRQCAGSLQARGQLAANLEASNQL
jgi:hypothetical protein